jgi:hypothetical protein
MKKSFRGFTPATIAAIKARFESGAPIPYKKDLPKKPPTITIGIDPAARKRGFGVCIYDKEDKTISFRDFGNYNDFFLWTLGEECPENARCVIESSNMQGRVFDGAGSKGVVQRKASDVGKNKAVSVLTVDACRRRWGAENVREVSPKGKGAKWTDRQALAVVAQMKLVLIGEMTEQDQRDALKLALML